MRPVSEPNKRGTAHARRGSAPVNATGKGQIRRVAQVIGSDERDRCRARSPHHSLQGSSGDRGLRLGRVSRNKRDEIEVQRGGKRTARATAAGVRSTSRVRIVDVKTPLQIKGRDAEVLDYEWASRVERNRLTKSKWTRRVSQPPRSGTKAVVSPETASPGFRHGS